MCQEPFIFPHLELLLIKLLNDILNKSISAWDNMAYGDEISIHGRSEKITKELLGYVVHKIHKLESRPISSTRL